MKERLKVAWKLIRRTYEAYARDNAARLAASIAFYAVFSVAPLLIIATAMAGFFVGEGVARAQAAEYIQRLTNPEMQAYILQLVERWQDPRSGIIATIIGLATLIWGAYRLFMALQDTLNMIWGVRPRDEVSWRFRIRTRLLPFLMVLLIGLFLILSMLISTAVSAVSQFFDELVAVPSTVVSIVNFGVSFGLITLLFAAAFKILPDVKIRWRDVWIGAGLTALLFAFGNSLIGLYLGHTSTTSIFGAAGSLVALLFWVYFSAQLFFLGAEFTQVYAKHIGERIEPDEEAMRVGRAQRRAEEAVDV